MHALDSPAADLARKPAPAEFRGLARLLRSRIVAAAEQSTPLIEAIFNDLAAIVRRRGKPPRDETMTDIIRKWRQIPANNRIGSLIVKHHRRGHIEIADTRLIGSKVTFIPEYGETNEIVVTLTTYAGAISVAKRRRGDFARYRRDPGRRANAAHHPGALLNPDPLRQRHVDRQIGQPA
jgi:hypothetical protein